MSVPLKTQQETQSPDADTTYSPPQVSGHISNVALKITMALTGLALALFVFVHMIGNLKAYMGSHAYDVYAQWLRELAYPFLPHMFGLWAFSIVLLICFLAHVWAATTLFLRGRKARGQFRRKLGTARFATRMMPVTGLVLLVFIIYHLLDMTFGIRPFAPSKYEHQLPSGEMEAYSNMVESFSRPGVAIFYALVMLFLALHLAHGILSLVSDLGVMGMTFRKWATIVGGLIAIAIMLVNASLPLAVLAGVLS